MYKKILVPMALDHGVSQKTLALANALLEAGGEIIAFHVYEMPQGSVSVYLNEDAVKAGFEKAHAALIQKTDGLENVRPVIEKGHSARTIIDFANSNDVDCIVVGSHKPGLSDYLLGSTAARVVRHAKCAVHVQRERNT